MSAADEVGEPAIETSELRKEFGGEVSVASLSLTVPKGSIVGLIGPSGCGKTTTVRLLTGVYAPTSGQACVLGRTPTSFRRADRRRIGYLPQRAPLYPTLSIAANLRFSAAIFGVGRQAKKRVDEALEFVELADQARKRVGQASGGMQRRVGLAAALVHDPELLFLDEPTAGLDPILRAKFWGHFHRLRDEGRTLLVTTQIVSEAAECEQVAVMADGELLAMDTPLGLRRRALGGDIVRVVTQQRLDAEVIASIMRLPCVRATNETPGGRLEVIVDDAGEAIAPLVRLIPADAGIVSVAQHLPPFDDVFAAIVRDGAVS